MNRELKLPATLMEAMRHFAKPGVALKHFARLRWPSGAHCPRCGEREPMFLETRQIWKCRGKGCGKQFSVKVGTVMEDSAIPLDKWLAAIWMLANCRNGVSSYEVARTIGVTQKTAWFLLQRIRLAMDSGSLDKMSGGPFEADETFIGGKVNNLKKSARPSPSRSARQRTHRFHRQGGDHGRTTAAG